MLHCVTVIAIVIVNYSKILLFDFCFFVYYAHFWLYCLCFFFCRYLFNETTVFIFTSK